MREFYCLCYCGFEQSTDGPDSYSNLHLYALNLQALVNGFKELVLPDIGFGAGRCTERKTKNRI